MTKPERIQFDALVEGEFCHPDCPRLEETLAGVPAYVRRAYPAVRNHECFFFGRLWEPPEGNGFLLQRPRRAVDCVKLALEKETREKLKKQERVCFSPPGGPMSPEEIIQHDRDVWKARALETEKRLVRPKRPMIYLAVPYTDDDPSVREYRFEEANKAAVKLVFAGNHVFSPISHTHPIALNGNLPIGWDYWADYDRLMLSICTHLVVLMLDGWRESTGVTAEIKIAREMGLIVEYMHPGTGSRKARSW